jgi:nucleoid-associated protein YgaU
VHFVGYLTKSTCDQLISWTTPVPVPALAARGSVAAASYASGSAPSMRSMAGSLTGGLAGAMASMASTRTPTAASTFAGRGTVYKLPLLLFSWGGGGGPIGLSYKVTIEKVDIHYERFNEFGVPVWAKINMTLKEFVDAPPLTNPTSGGPAGRTKHVVTAGENIVRIANTSYGSPAAWRAVAEANGLDDPLRIKPGRLLDLPGPDELMQGVAS